ncbi:MAG: iron-containing alcohol dehydrogenase, partial [Clostridia bacterium]|nr:iron-containing alcohol dehydrogenase [Clostridia bacterium]
SMDGYASTGAAMITAGMKVTYSAGLPEGIIADVDVLKNAPMEMIKAGYGDIIGKYSALSDWRLAKEALGEYFCEYVWELTMSMLKQILPLAKKLLNRDADSVKTLTEALIGVGIAMSFVGNSRPASGSEHHLSHFFEITGIVHGEEYLPHGIDVLYSAALTARLREELLSQKPPFAPYTEDRDAWEKELRRVYTSAADGIIALQDKVGLYTDIDVKQLEKAWESVCAILREAPGYEQMLSYVTAIGLDINECKAFYGKEILSDALRYAKDLKDRYTVLWIAYALGVGYHE